MLLSTGCHRSETTDPTEPVGSDADKIPIRVAVYAEEALAKQIELGWQGVSEHPATATSVTGRPLVDVARESDVIVMPAKMIGQAVKTQAIAAFPESFVVGDALGFEQFFSQLRQMQVRWGRSVVGLPLGSPVAMTLVRDDVAVPDEGQPLSFAQFSKLAAEVSQSKPSAAEPLAEGEAAISFLRRAAAYTSSPWLFDVETFDPEIAGPSYIRALSEMVADRKHYPAELLTAKQIWRRLNEGELKLAIGWPVNTDEESDSASIKILPAPVADEVFAMSWKSVDEGSPRRGVLHSDGLIVAISSACRQSSASRNLAMWMVHEGHAGLQRTSPWISTVRSPIDSETGSRLQTAAALQYDRLAADGLTYMVAHPMLRIPHAEEYLAALDQHVLDALAGNRSPEESLQNAADAWRNLNQKLGTEDQKNAWSEGRGY
ncbi:MAG: hypothetical protein R3C05_08095 [Pirellulaceae bacterium]